MFKPLLSPREDPLSYPDYFKKLQYPYLCSPKIDGIRGIVDGNNIMRSRTWKPIPSIQVQEELTRIEFLDGELTAGNPWLPNIYNVTQSHVMSFDKPAGLS